MPNSPNFQDFESQYNQGKNQIIWQEFNADCETPVSVFLKCTGDQPYSFLLESIERAKNRARYSIIGYQPDIIFTAFNEKSCKITKNGNIIQESDNPKLVLSKLIKEIQMTIPENIPKAASGIFGYLSYDAVRLFEKIPDKNPALIGVPWAQYFRPQIVIIFDNIKDSLMIINLVVYDKNTTAMDAWAKAQNNIAHESSKLTNPVQNIIFKQEKNHNHAYKIQPQMTSMQYQNMVVKAKKYIAAGDIFQVVLSQRFKIQDFDSRPFAYYRALRTTNPSPYMFYFNMDNFAIAGASPETLVKLEDAKITIRPLAGTRKRGANSDEDKKNELDLLGDEKERAEHLMLLDLGRNDVGRVAKANSVEVSDQFQIERYSHVMHIVSQVNGLLDNKYDALDALMAGMPAGTVSGAPKIRAMEIIDECESLKREIYAGAIGYFSADKDMDHCIALRTAVIKNSHLYIQAGAGIVYDSLPESEDAECQNKAKALMVAAEIAHKFDFQIK